MTDYETRQVELMTCLARIKDNHKIWDNPLLDACNEGLLSPEDFKYLFTQYYYYSNSFTQILASIMVKCDNTPLRAELINNFLEESGENEQKKPHSEIFKLFLSEGLGVNISNPILTESYAKHFVDMYINLCLKENVLECAVILAFATEGIVSHLYSIFRAGLIKAGIEERHLIFFDIHIACDDEHADTLKKIVNHYSKTITSYESCIEALNISLNLRDEFFKNIFFGIQQTKINDIILSVINNDGDTKNILDIHHKINFKDTSCKLYGNKNQKNGIDFNVKKVLCKSTVLDPRVLIIEENSKNENHMHAHESVFFIIEGSGIVIINNIHTVISKGDIIYIPRWVLHQTINNTNTKLIIFAITDFKFTTRFAGNTEESYRQVNTKMEALA